MLLYPEKPCVQRLKKTPKTSPVGFGKQLLSRECRQNHLIFKGFNIAEIRFGCTGCSGIQSRIAITIHNQTVYLPHHFWIPKHHPLVPIFDFYKAQACNKNRRTGSVE
jgi:hypothetical protein